MSNHSLTQLLSSPEGRAKLASALGPKLNSTRNHMSDTAETYFMDSPINQVHYMELGACLVPKPDSIWVSNDGSQFVVVVTTGISLVQYSSTSTRSEAPLTMFTTEFTKNFKPYHPQKTSTGYLLGLPLTEEDPMSIRTSIADLLHWAFTKFEPKVANYYGWKPQHPDYRDMQYSTAKPAAENLVTIPQKIDLRSKLPACWDQGQLGSCTAHGISAALVFDENFENESFMMPSRLFIYYNERVIEHDTRSDNGAQIRDGIKSVASSGFADEKTWPYVPKKFATKPPASAYANATKHKSLTYMALDNTKVDELKSCLAAGFPFVFGFTVYDYFEGAQIAKDGILNMPAPNESTVGGHCVCAVGYDDTFHPAGWSTPGGILVRNSWNTDWGINGHFWMPYSYISNANLASDFWTIRKIS